MKKYIEICYIQSKKMGSVSGWEGVSQEFLLKSFPPTKFAYFSIFFSYQGDLKY